MNEGNTSRKYDKCEQGFGPVGLSLVKRADCITIIRVIHVEKVT